MANWSKQFKQIDTINSGQEYTLNDYVTLDMVNAPLNNTQYLYDLLFSDGLITFLQNEYAKVDTDGAIVHMRDLEYYGSRPAVLSADFIEDWATWNQNKNTYNPGAISPADQRVTFLPNDSHNSIEEVRAEYISGTTDFIECRIIVAPSSSTSSYATIRFVNINTTHPNTASGGYPVYGPDIVNQSGGSNYRSKSTTFKVTIKDMYGHIYTKNYTINYAIHYTQE